MIIKSKTLKIGNTFEHICFKCVFDIENYEFWKCVFNKIYSFLCYLKCGCIIYEWYRPRYNKK
jgi:hypothetical protein